MSSSHRNSKHSEKLADVPSITITLNKIQGNEFTHSKILHDKKEHSNFQMLIGTSDVWTLFIALC